MLRELNMVTTVTTNGMLLDRRRIEMLHGAARSRSNKPGWDSGVPQPHAWRLARICNDGETFARSARVRLTLWVHLYIDPALT